MSVQLSGSALWAFVTAPVAIVDAVVLHGRYQREFQGRFEPVRLPGTDTNMGEPLGRSNMGPTNVALMLRTAT
jgi:hypothetical protein